MHRARLDLLARLLIALVRQSTVTLSKLALVLNPDVKPASNHRRLQRFFAQVTLPVAARVALVLHWLGEGAVFGDTAGGAPTGGAPTGGAPTGGAPTGGAPRRYVLAIDRTEWTFGRLHLNVLVVALCTKAIAVPLVWTILPGTDGRFGATGSKHGCSTGTERIALMREVLHVLPRTRIRAVLGDREFASRAWLAFLAEEQIPFVMRVKGTVRTSVRGGGVPRPNAAPSARPGSAPMQRVFGLVPPGTVAYAQRRRLVCGVRLHVGAIGHATDPVYLVATLPLPEAARLYAARWQIETLFRALKSQGFRLDGTHLHHRDRISELIGVLALAFVWAHRVGAWTAALDPPRVHWRPNRRPLRRGSMRAVPHRSQFRRGLDTLQAHFACPGACVDPMLYCLQAIVLSCT